MYILTDVVVAFILLVHLTVLCYVIIINHNCTDCVRVYNIDIHVILHCCSGMGEPC